VLKPNRAKKAAEVKERDSNQCNGVDGQSAAVKKEKASEMIWL
jgi:hypothetical protein